MSKNIIIKNSVWNISAYFIPALIALPATAFLARHLNKTDFGLESLIAVIFSYAGLFDLGLSRAIIKFVSYHRENIDSIGEFIASSLLFAIVSGSILSIIIIFFNYEIAVKLLNVSSDYLNNTQKSLWLVAFCIPVFLLTNIFNAHQEGMRNFRSLSIQRMILGSLYFINPVVVVYYIPNIFGAVLGIVITRFLGFIYAFVASTSLLSFSYYKVSKKAFIELIKFSSWITISNIISPIMIYLDRFMISNLMGASNVSQYSAPSDLVNKFSIFPAAIARAVFPTLSSKTGDKLKEYKFSLLLNLCVALAICMPMIIFAKFVIILILGNEYAGNTVVVFRILLVGLICNAVALIPFASVQAKGRADITAKIHMCEFPLYILLIYFMATNYGVIGIAFAWTCRMILDMILLLILNNGIKVFK